jgi:hypothetical protein
MNKDLFYNFRLHNTQKEYELFLITLHRRAIMLYTGISLCRLISQIPDD